jgi:hypothetical protein
MLEINLLPWRGFVRAKQRRKKIVIFFSALSVVLFSGCLAHRIFIHEKGLKNYMLIEQSKKLYAETSLNQQLQKIKYIGYLAQDRRKCAMLLLPSGAVRDVQAGAEVGIGGARVVSVSAEKVILVLPDNQLVTILSG